MDRVSVTGRKRKLEHVVVEFVSVFEIADLYVKQPKGALSCHER